jgi:hypothetical protein
MRAPDETLAFEVREGSTHNLFHRCAGVAAHLVATSGNAPRLVVAFPAGNNGAALWFEPLPTPVAMTVEGTLEPVIEGAMRGVRATVTLAAVELVVRRAVLGSVRAIRRFATDGEVVAGMECAVDRGEPYVFHRTTLDGRRHVALRVEALDGTSIATDAGGRVIFRAPPGGAIRARFTAVADDPPLTPIPMDELFNEAAAPDPLARRTFAFLAYEEKLLAGSWRFLTYFGRDTLLALRLMMPVLTPRVIEAGLGSVIDRLGPDGEVAHEEALGEWAAVERRAAGIDDANDDEPLLDRSMIDDDFLLAPVVAAYLLEGAGRARAADFLARTTPAGETYAAALAQNLALVLRRAASFAAAFDPRALVAIAPGRATGDWRDSEDGLGGGRIPFSVNAALVPAALAAAANLYASSLFEPDARASARAAALARFYRRAPSFFQVEIDAAEARRRVAAYADSIGIAPGPAVAAMDGDLRFPAIALDEQGEPIPVMHSDDGFALLFADPMPEYLEDAAARVTRPFPAGLRTPAGIVASNPAFCTDRKIRERFTPAHYHGVVVWSWQHALLAAGIDRQLRRADLPLRTLAALAEARRVVGEIIRDSAPYRSSELWSVAARKGALERVPFGAVSAHHDESNAAQLWSAVYLAIADATPGT